MIASATETKQVRCAIYTRKSTEENLNLDFNSLDAQREAGEAYIKSQQSEGWAALPDRYDDGGFSGGTIERPAFQRLLADVEAGSAYAAAPTITASGGSATRQATFLVNLDGDKIGSVTVLDSGLDYTAAPTLTYAGNAILEPVIVGMLDSLAVTDGGAGYDKASPPAVTIANTGTVLATATAVVDDDGKVSGLTLTGRGFGFFTAPAVTIAPPPGYPGEGKAIATAKAVVA